MKCNVCNAELKEEQSFCPYCGTKIEKQVESAPVESRTEAANVSVSGPGPSNPQMGRILRISLLLSD